MITEQEYENRLIRLHKKADELGASFEHELRGCKHLLDFWYGGNSIAEIEYRGYTICFDVCGDVCVILYDGEQFVEVLKRKGEGEPFGDNSEVLEKIVDDERLLQKIQNYELVFDNNNWINIVIQCNATGEYVSEPEVAGESNLLEAIENAFDPYIAYIDKLIAEGGSENESDD